MAARRRRGLPVVRLESLRHWRLRTGRNGVPQLPRATSTSRVRGERFAARVGLERAGAQRERRTAILDHLSDVPSEARITLAIAILDSLAPGDRLIALREFCIGCGADDPDCQCLAAPPD